ncbi:MAG: branched-chain amino acid ABC transporter permease [Vulcanimicrobiaceae bacterium]
MAISSYAAGLIAGIGINTLAGLGAYVMWSSGQLSLGNAAFLALGAYASALCTVDFGLPLPLALVVAVIVTGAVGIAVGFPALRVRGIYLAIATLAFGEIVRTFFLNFPPTGGAQGFHGMKPTTPLVIWSCVGIVLAGLLMLERSRLWLEYRAVSDDETAASLVGLDTTLVKVGAFGLGAAITALAGALFAHYLVYIEPADFSFERSIELVLYVILGGSTTVFGPFLGAAFLTLLPEILRFVADWRLAVYGALLLVILLVRREGLLSRTMFRRRVL